MTEENNQETTQHPRTPLSTKVLWVALGAAIMHIGVFFTAKYAARPQETYVSITCVSECSIEGLSPTAARERVAAAVNMATEGEEPPRWTKCYQPAKVTMGEGRVSLVPPAEFFTDPPNVNRECRYAAKENP